MIKRIQMPIPPRSRFFVISDIIGANAFGVIELLITLVVVSLLAYFAFRNQMRVQHDSVPSELREPLEKAIGRLRSDLEASGKVEFLFFRKDSMAAKNQNGEFEYSYVDTASGGEWVRTDSKGSETILGNVVKINLTAYNTANHFLTGDPGMEELKSVQRVTAEVSIHGPQEDRNRYANDRIHGFDLDGDVGNGVAPVYSRTVGFIVSH